MGTRVRVRPVPWSSPDAYPSGGNPSLSHRWAKWHSRLMAPIESRTLDWRMGFGLQTARTGLRYRNPVIERTATSRVSKSFRGDLQLGKVAMPRGPRSEKRPADVMDRFHPRVPTIVWQGGLRQLLDEYRRHQHDRMH